MYILPVDGIALGGKKHKRKSDKYIQIPEQKIINYIIAK